MGPGIFKVKEMTVAVWVRISSCWMAWRLSLAFNISSTATSRPVMNWDESVFIRILPPDHGIGRF